MKQNMLLFTNNSVTDAFANLDLQFNTVGEFGNNAIVDGSVGGGSDPGLPVPMSRVQ